MISNIFAILFYSTLLLFIFVKIYNYSLIKKYDCKELYKKQREEIKKTKFLKVIKIVLIISIISLILYIPYGITNFYFSLAFMIVDKGDKLNDFFDIMSIILYTVYFILITYKLYINILLNKYLQNYKNV